MSGGKHHIPQRWRDARTPRVEKADAIERRWREGEPPSTKIDAAAAARNTRTGRRDSLMQDPDAPTVTRPRGQAASRMREGRHPTPGAGQGFGAGVRRRKGKHKDH